MAVWLLTAAILVVACFVGLALLGPAQPGPVGVFARSMQRPALLRRSLMLDVSLVILAGTLSALFAPGLGLTPTPYYSVFASTWAVLMWLPLIWRRRFPELVALVVAFVTISHMLAGFILLIPADAAILVALYSVAALAGRWAHITALGLALAGSLMLAVMAVRLSQGYLTLLEMMPIVVIGSALALAAWALGLMRGARRETLSALRERNAALEDRAVQLEIERDQQAQIATQNERARIAREMHDIVAHSLSIMIVQADGGRYMAAANPTAAGEALGTIAATGREALAEMRRLLGILRADDDAKLELAPQSGQAGNADLQTLFDQALASGMALTVEVVGSPAPLSASAALTLHRACQEALTNVRKHAGPGVNVRALVDWGPGSVTLQVTDDGRGAAHDAADPGFGLVGLRERADLVGGTVASGPAPGGGWITRFTMPTK